MAKNQLFHSYLKYYAIAFSSLLSSVLIFNLGIDPYGDFRLIDIPGINREKTLSDSSSQGQRRSKGNEFTDGKYDTIILGTSRALVGIDPQQKVFQQDRAYNLALSGSNMYEIHKVYKYARQTQNLEKVILSLDFFTFSDTGEVRGDFNLSKFSANGYLFRVLLNHASFDNLIMSLKTLKNNYEGLQQVNNLGFDNSKLERKVKNGNNYRYLFDTNLTNNFFVLQRAYAGYSYSQDRLDLFREIVADCLANDTELYLFISPIHARQIEAISIMGLFPTFERWKRDLVNIIDEESARLEKTAPLLWDFSGYNSITTEAIPLQGETGKMQWYYESSHYTKDVGNILLQKMLNYPQQTASFPKDFGTIINTTNIEKHLEKTRKDREEYQINYAFEIAEVERLFESVRDSDRKITDEEEF